MKTAFDKSILRAGDCLLYRPKDLFGWVTAVKTWRKVAHVEVYQGGGMSMASRNGIGVNLYALRTDQLGYVLRPSVGSPSPWPSPPGEGMPPRSGFSFEQATAYFESVRGEKYDWKGLLCFTLAVHQGAKDRLFCSEFATNYYRSGGCMVFSLRVSADTISPGDFLETPVMDEIWSDEPEPVMPI